MTVYVDIIVDYGWNLGPSCHMYADSLDELHKAAQAIGLRKAWFQVSKSGIPHYDLTKSRRRLAVRQGFKEFTPTLDDLKRFKETLRPAQNRTTPE